MRPHRCPPPTDLWPCWYVCFWSPPLKGAHERHAVVLAHVQAQGGRRGAQQWYTGDDHPTLRSHGRARRGVDGCGPGRQHQGEDKQVRLKYDAAVVPAWLVRYLVPFSAGLQSSAVRSAVTVTTSLYRVPCFHGRAAGDADRGLGGQDEVEDKQVPGMN